MSNALTPWFKRGVIIAAAQTSDQAMLAGGLDWKVELRKIQQQVNGKEIPWFFANVRMDNDVCLGVVGSSYHTLQNVDAFSMGDALVKDNIATYDSTGAFGNGEKVWLLMKRPDFFEVVPGDVVSSYIGIVNSHDGNSSLRVFPIPIRQVSDTTLNITSSHKNAMVQIKHTVSMARRISQLHSAVKKIDDEFKQLELDAKLLVKKQMTQPMVDKFMVGLLKGLAAAKVHPKTTSMHDSILRYYTAGTGNTIPGVAGTAWAMLNGVAEWTDFDKSTRIMDADSDVDTQRAKSLLFGDGQEYKQIALELLLEL